MASANTDQMLQDLLNTEVQMRKMQLTLDTNITSLEVNPTGSEPPEVTPEKIELVSDKISLAMKTFVAQYRKYYHLFPQRRQHVTRRSFREDSGIGSGIFNDDAAAFEVCTAPIQESLETPNPEKNSAIEHSESDGKEVDPDKTFSASVHSATEVTHV